MVELLCFSLHTTSMCVDVAALPYITVIVLQFANLALSMSAMVHGTNNEVFAVITGDERQKKAEKMMDDGEGAGGHGYS